MFEQVKDILIAAGNIMTKTTEYSVTKKGKTDFVTDVDVSVQNFLIKELRNIIPDAEFMGEEKNNDDINWNHHVWIIDPIDGTTNFLHGFLHSTISVALAYKKEIIMGIVYQPFTEELFYSETGKGSYYNGEKIHVTNNTIENGLIAIGTVPGCRTLANESFSIARQIYDRCHDIRRIGCASYEMCYLAAGKLDGFVELSLKPWDYAAGMLILKEAGGKCCTPYGKELRLDEASGIVAGNECIFEEIYDLVNFEMSKG